MKTARHNKSRSTTLRWWRWRRNPLRRPSDLIEAWILLAAWAFALVAGLCAGLATAVAVDQRFAQQRAERQSVSAVLLHPVPAHPAAAGSGNRQVLAEVRWTAPDGSRHQDETRVAPGTPAGTRITIWADQHGRQTAKPPSPEDSMTTAVIFATMAAAAAGGVVWGGTRAVRGHIDRQRMQQWADEWQRFDTHWGRPKTS
ncbi:MAG: hypothetical protein HOY79_41530 [Streptomyces sp.]|nr:hypothetical protein [Streptomyces sp.]